MASFTIAQLKTAVANIPAGANTWLVEMPDIQVPVVTGRKVDAQGNITYLVRGYIDFTTRTWIAVQ